ncbi:MAG: hypothetical protein V1790_16145 [Planctomycetota bacterium]
MSASKPRVLNVGQCDYDHGNIRRMLSEEFGADVERAADTEEAVRAVPRAAALWDLFHIVSL